MVTPLEGPVRSKFWAQNSELDIGVPPHRRSATRFVFILHHVDSQTADGRWLANWTPDDKSSSPDVRIPSPRIAVQHQSPQLYTAVVHDSLQSYIPYTVLYEPPSLRKLLRITQVEKFTPQKIVEVPVMVERIVEVEKEVIKEVPVERIIEKEVIKEVPVERIIEKEVIKEIPVETIVEKEAGWRVGEDSFCVSFWISKASMIIYNC